MSASLMDFGLGETADAIRETTARFAADKIAPLAAGIDETNTFPRELWPQMGGLGLHGITVEEEWGGLGLGTWSTSWPWKRFPGRRGPSVYRTARIRIFA